jgi:hypothetical protein
MALKSSYGRHSCVHRFFFAVSSYYQSEVPSVRRFARLKILTLPASSAIIGNTLIKNYKMCLGKAGDGIFKQF